jgi:hypothetical protein
VKHVKKCKSINARGKMQLELRNFAIQGKNCKILYSYYGVDSSDRQIYGIDNAIVYLIFNWRMMHGSNDGPRISFRNSLS